MKNTILVGPIIHREKGTHWLVTVLVKRIELAKALFRCHLTGNNRQLFLADGPEIYPLKNWFWPHLWIRPELLVGAAACRMHTNDKVSKTCSTRKYNASRVTRWR